MRSYLALPLVALALSLTACGSDAADSDEPSYPSDYVGKVEIKGDTDVELRQFNFTDLDGVKQKCFLFAKTRGSVTCQAVVK